MFYCVHGCHPEGLPSPVEFTGDGTMIFHAEDSYDYCTVLIFVDMLGMSVQQAN